MDGSDPVLGQVAELSIGDRDQRHFAKRAVKRQDVQKASLHLGPGEVLVPCIDGFELRPIDRDARRTKPFSITAG